MNYLYYCPTCKKINIGGDENIATLKCPSCNSTSFLTKVSYAEYERLSEERKDWFKEVIEAVGHKEIKQMLDEVNEIDRKKIAEENHNHELELMRLASKIQITTTDLHQDYEIIAPVYFQLNDHGTTFGMLRNKYSRLIQSLKSNGQTSNDKTSGIETLGAVVNVLSILSGGPQDRDLIGNQHALFDEAFFIACEELKRRAYALGADAIVGMRQDIDLDTNGFQHFYLQMYGTAVRTKKD